MCDIQWIDEHGKATPDDNAPIGRVRCKVYGWRGGIGGVREPWKGDYSAWFTCCAEHAKRLAEPDMVEWEIEPLKNFEITFVWPNGDWTWIYESAPDFHDVLAIALDKCPPTCRVHAIQFMTPQQVDANRQHAARRFERFPQNQVTENCD